jgi:hypothetical protein
LDFLGRTNFFLLINLVIWFEIYKINEFGKENDLLESSTMVKKIILAEKFIQSSKTADLK